MLDYINFLREQGLDDREIRIAIDLKVNGIYFTKAIYRFNAAYDKQEIDGFPDSAIEILEEVYGKKLELMKPKTILKKVLSLQQCLTTEPDEDECLEAVNRYLGG